MSAGSDGRDPRLLLLMARTSYRATAFLDAAARLGVQVVIGTDNPEMLTPLAPEASLALDFADTDASVSRILEHARREPLDAVVPAEDDGAVLAAAAAAALGLPHNPVAAVRAARDKHQTRTRLAAAGLPTPGFRLVEPDAATDELAREVPFPCVVKPVALSASRGVIRADSRAELETALRRLGAMVAGGGPGPAGAPSGRVLVERYIPGTEVALEGLLLDGRLEVLALFDKPDPLEGPYFEETLYVTPSRHPAAVRDAVAEATARAAAALGLRDGPVHAELRHNDEGAWLIELGPRSIGGLCSRVLRFQDGISLEELILRHALGQPVDHIEREAGAAGVMMIPIPERGTLHEVRGVDLARRVPFVEDVVITIPVGHEVVPLPEGNRYLGFIFARADSPERVEAALRTAERVLDFEIG